MTDTKTRDQELLEEFQAGLEKDGPVVLVKRIVELEEQVKALTADQAGLEMLATDAENRVGATDEYLLSELEALGYPRNGGPEDATPAQKAIFALTGVMKDRDDARAEAKSADKARAKIERASAPAKPRKLGEIAESKQLTGDELREAIEEAETVEIAFSDGDREIGTIAPAIVSGDAWKVHPRGLMLAKPVTIEGSGAPSSVEIGGYALLIDGKQVAWSERSDKLRVAPGQRVDLVDDIIF